MNSVMRYIKLAVLLFCISILQTARADVVWPALYLAGGFGSILVVMAGLVVEIGFVKYFTEASWTKIVLTSLAMNICTLTLGCVAIALCGLGMEFLSELIKFILGIKTGTFHYINWLVAYATAVTVNTLIEGGVIYQMMDKPLKETFIWLYIANTISVGICCVYIYFCDPHPVYF